MYLLPIGPSLSIEYSCFVFYFLYMDNVPMPIIVKSIFKRDIKDKNTICKHIITAVIEEK